MLDLHVYAMLTQDQLCKLSVTTAPHTACVSCCQKTCLCNVGDQQNSSCRVATDLAGQVKLWLSLVGRYIPNARMQYEYPGTYQASDAQSCASDSNLLLHDDPDHYADPYADPYEDNPDSQHGQCPAEEAEVQSQQTAASELDSKAGSGNDTGQVTAAEAEVPVEGTNGSDDTLPEQSAGTDVKR